MINGGKPRRQLLSLVMTEKCNLDCTYCYEHKVDGLILPLEVAQKAIREAFANDNFDELEIDFFGGEPLVAFRGVVAICEWLWTNEWPKPYICFASTNGTLLHGHVAEWFEKYKERFILGLSLDGTPEMHDVNRSNSYSKIDFGLFRRLWPFQAAKMTVSRETLPTMAKGVIHIHNLGFKVSCSTAFGLQWTDTDYALFEREMRLLADYYLENPEIEPCNIISMQIEHIHHASKKNNYCGAGTNLTVVDRRGDKYPCQTFLPMTTGGNVDIPEMFSLLSRGQEKVNLRCEQCSLLPLCQTCYGLNLKHQGDMYNRAMSNCYFTKIRAKATAYLYAGMITNQEKDYIFLRGKTEDELYYMINGIQTVTNTVVVPELVELP